MLLPALRSECWNSRPWPICTACAADRGRFPCPLPMPAAIRTQLCADRVQRRHSRSSALGLHNTAHPGSSRISPSPSCAALRAPRSAYGGIGTNSTPMPGAPNAQPADAFYVRRGERPYKAPSVCGICAAGLNDAFASRAALGISDMFDRVPLFACG